MRSKGNKRLSNEIGAFKSSGKQKVWKCFYSLYCRNIFLIKLSKPA
jgi:hypothetical protein